MTTLTTLLAVIVELWKLSIETARIIKESENKKKDVRAIYAAFKNRDANLLNDVFNNKMLDPEPEADEVRGKVEVHRIE